MEPLARLDLSESAKVLKQFTWTSMQDDGDLVKTCHNPFCVTDFGKQ